MAATLFWCSLAVRSDEGERHMRMSMNLMSSFYSGLCFLMVLSGCSHGAGDFSLEQRSDFQEQHDAALGITSETHGTPREMAPFSRRDVPQKLPVRESTFSNSGLGLVVKHSQGYSTVEPLYELNVHKRYRANGRGDAVPVSLRINPPINPNLHVRLPRSEYRLLETSGEYEFGGRFIAARNRSAAIGLAREVLSKSHCLGGTVTKDAAKPEFAQSFGRNARNASGYSIEPGWVVHFRCSRWRKS